MRFETVLVTPEMAANWLAKPDPRNKKRVRKAWVDFLAEAILSGHFQTTHQPIAISTSGMLIDGEHRLRAIVQANTAVLLNVAYDFDQHVYSVTDCGMPRTMSIRLGVDRARTSICQTILRFCNAEGKNRQHEYEVQLVLDAFGPHLDELESFVPINRRKGRMRSMSICAAAVIRIAESIGTPRYAFVHDLIHRAMNEELVGASPVTISFYKQMQMAPTGGYSAQKLAFCRAWDAFDPAKAQNTKLQIHDTSTAIGAARRVFERVTHGVFA